MEWDSVQLLVRYHWELASTTWYRIFFKSMMDEKNISHPGLSPHTIFCTSVVMVSFDSSASKKDCGMHCFWNEAGILCKRRIRVKRKKETFRQQRFLPMGSVLWIGQKLHHAGLVRSHPCEELQMPLFCIASHNRNRMLHINSSFEYLPVASSRIELQTRSNFDCCYY